MKRSVSAAGAMVLIALAAGCSVTTEKVPEETLSGGDGPRYVAIGDSYTSGPGIDKQLTAAGLCLRSDNNYPSLLAKRLEVEAFVDVSCAGATTGDAIGGSSASPNHALPPQVEAVTHDAELVTISLGGNDSRVFSLLFGSCGLIDGRRTGLCIDFVDNTAPSLLKQLSNDLTKVIEGIKQVAPDSRIVVVGYLRMLPESGSCETVPVAPADHAAAVQGEQALHDAQQDAATRAGVEFVSMRDVSIGHDACAGADAWVNGVETPPPGDGSGMHPNAAGMKAVADQVFELVG